MTPEKIVQRSVCHFLKMNHFFIFTHDSVGIWDASRKLYRKNLDPFRLKGVSDLLGILPDGRFLAIEIKSKTGRVSPEQKAFIEAIRLSGGVAFVARDVRDVEVELAQYLPQSSRVTSPDQAKQKEKLPQPKVSSHEAIK